MPTLDLIPMDGTFATLEQAQIAKEYLGYIDKLEPGQIGRLTPADGETLHAVLRRIGVAAMLPHKTLDLSQTQHGLSFWPRSGPKRRQRKGRKTAANGDK